MIYWKGKSTNGILRYKAIESSFIKLFNELMNREIINNYDYDVYDNAVLKKHNKSFEDAEFQNEDGELDYEKVREFVEKHNLTDEEIWLLISLQDGNAYYQKFERENENKERIEISKEDFDENGNYLY